MHGENAGVVAGKNGSGNGFIDVVVFVALVGEVVGSYFKWVKYSCFHSVEVCVVKYLVSKYFCVVGHFLFGCGCEECAFRGWKVGVGNEVECHGCHCIMCFVKAANVELFVLFLKTGCESVEGLVGDTDE